MLIKNFLLGIAIIIVTISVVIYGINTFYSKPVYEDFCGEYKTQEIIETQEQCEAIGGQWNSYQSVKPEEISGYCDRDYSCREEYDKGYENFRRNIFLITIPLGIIIIALGALVFNLDAVGAGLMGGGVGTILYGTGGYWQYTENWVRFLISLVGLVALILLAYYANRKWNKKKKK
jgi:small-conductance mechanosensitive channel